MPHLDANYHDPSTLLHPQGHTSMACVALLLLLVESARAAPGIALPFNEQIPPVALISQPYVYRLAPDTFSPTGPDTVYSLQDSPAWLQFNDKSQSLWGSPGSGDVGISTFAIVAAFPGGSYTLTGSIPVQASATVGTGTIPNSLNGGEANSRRMSFVLGSSQPISITVPETVFTGTTAQTSYYAANSDHTALPPWISFDSNQLSFSGVTPRVVGAPQNFNLLVMASDTQDSEEASIPMAITVKQSAHTLSFFEARQTVNIRRGTYVNVKDLRSQIMLDGRPLQDRDIKSASADIPSWLNFDNQSFDITGEAPVNITSANVKINVIDRFGDTASTTLFLRFSADMFAGEIKPQIAKPGKPFTYTIARNILVEPTAHIEVSFEPAVTWLHFNPGNLTITGDVPTNVNEQVIVASVKAHSPTLGLAGSEAFQIRVPSITTNSNSTPSPSPDTHPGMQAATNGGKYGSKKVLTVAVAISCIVVFVVLLIVILLMCRPSARRKRRQKKMAPPKWTISRPMTQLDEDWLSPDTYAPMPSTEQGPRAFGEPAGWPNSRPPHLSLALSKHMSEQQREPGLGGQPQTTFLNVGESRTASQYRASRHSGLADRGLRPGDLTRIAREANAHGTRQSSDTMISPLHHVVWPSANHVPLNSDVSLRHQDSRYSLASSRFVGMGHGRTPSNVNSYRPASIARNSLTPGILTPGIATSSPNRDPVANSHAVFPSGETPLSPPLPLHFNKRRANVSLASTYKRRSVRLLPPDSSQDIQESINEESNNRHSHVERRQSFLLKRARGAWSPFFGSRSGDSSRRTSAAGPSQLLQRRSHLSEFETNATLSAPPEGAISSALAKASVWPDANPPDTPKNVVSPTDEVESLMPFPNSLRTRSQHSRPRPLTVTTVSRAPSSNRSRRRFRSFAEGFPRPVGSPTRLASSSRLGSKRTLHSFRSSWASSRRFDDAEERSQYQDESIHSQEETSLPNPSFAESSGTQAYTEDTSQAFSSQGGIEIMSNENNSTEDEVMTGVEATGALRTARSAAPSPVQFSGYPLTPAAARPLSRKSSCSSVSIRTNRMRNQRQSTGSRLGLGLDLQNLILECDPSFIDSPSIRQNMDVPSQATRKPSSEWQTAAPRSFTHDVDTTLSTGLVSRGRRIRRPGSLAGSSANSLAVPEQSPHKRIPLSPVSSGALATQSRTPTKSMPIFDSQISRRPESVVGVQEGSARLRGGRAKRPISVEGTLQGKAWGSLRGEVAGTGLGHGKVVASGADAGEDLGEGTSRAESQLDGLRGNEAFL